MNSKAAKKLRREFLEKNKYKLAKRMYQRLNWLDKTKVNAENKNGQQDSNS